MLWSRNSQLHYPFQNTALDYSGNARHGTVLGTGAYATKPDGSRCLYFDGVGDYVTTPSFGLIGTVVVFAAHVRSKTLATRQGILAEATSSNTIGFLWAERWQNSNHARWWYANGAGVSAAQAIDIFAAPYEDAWMHLLIVCDYDGKQTYFYRNATLFTTIAMAGTPVFPSTARVKYVGSYNAFDYLLTASYLQNVQLWTLPTMPAASHMLANVNRIMLGMNPIW